MSGGSYSGIGATMSFGLKGFENESLEAQRTEGKRLLAK